jgi:hypothetical protein
VTLIQEYFKAIGETLAPSLTWSIDYYVGENVGVVYSEGGSASTGGETQLRQPHYMIMIRSKQWEDAEHIANSLFKTLDHTYNQTFTTTKNKTFEIYSILASGEPIRLGVDTEGFMQYTINFTTLLREVTEHA